MYDFIILGAGITGISFARLLQLNNVSSNFLILEKNNEAGGLCRTKNINGHIIDIGGGHFFGTKIPEVEQFVFNHISKDNFNYYKRVSKISINNSIIDYPIECNLWQLPIELQVKYIMSIIKSKTDVEDVNFKDWIINKLGDRIACDYMIPYNEKVWGENTDALDIDWLSKIPSLNLEEILYYCLKRDNGENKIPNHLNFYYPKLGGFQSIFDSIYKYVRNYVKVNENITSCIHDGKKWIINNQYESSVVINTVPWIEIFKPLGSPINLKDDFDNLKANTIEVSLYEQEYDHNWHWVYMPDKSYKHHRMYYISNFAPMSKLGGVCTESNEKSKGETFSNMLYQESNKYAYPIPVKNHKQSIKNILDYYRSKNMYGLGRWGQWGCLVADICIFESMKLIKELSYKKDLK